MKLRILAIGDTANNVRFFESYLISEQVKKINQIKSNYDLCFVSSWEGARVAFLANINYVFFFVGQDVYQQPFIKNATPRYLKKPIHTKNFFERWFLRQVLNSAIACVTYGGKNHLEKLQKFHPNVYRMDMIPVDEIFLKKHMPINKKKEKFTFLSPQRQGLEKGMDVIWKAVELAKSDFVMLQMDWFDRRTPEEEELANNFIKNKPKKIKIIPMVKWEEIPNYYVWADVVMGQMRFLHGGIEREAVLCGTPVLNYNDENHTYLIDNEECVAGFLPNSKGPKELAKTIDKIIEDEKFRNELYKQELEFVTKLTDPEIIGVTWDKIFDETNEKSNSIHRKDSLIKLKVLNSLSKVMENLIYKKRWKYKQE